MGIIDDEYRKGDAKECRRVKSLEKQVKKLKKKKNKHTTIYKCASPWKREEGQLLVRVVFDIGTTNAYDEIHMSYPINIEKLGQTIKLELGEDLWVQLSLPFEEMNPQ